jgi:hypothetical protein
MRIASPINSQLRSGLCQNQHFPPGRPLEEIARSRQIIHFPLQGVTTDLATNVVPISQKGDARRREAAALPEAEPCGLGRNLLSAGCP